MTSSENRPVTASRHHNAKAYQKVKARSAAVTLGWWHGPELLGSGASGRCCRKHAPSAILVRQDPSEPTSVKGTCFHQQPRKHGTADARAGQEHATGLQKVITIRPDDFPNGMLLAAVGAAEVDLAKWQDLEKRYAALKSPWERANLALGVLGALRESRETTAGPASTPTAG